LRRRASSTRWPKSGKRKEAPRAAGRRPARPPTTTHHLSSFPRPLYLSTKNTILKQYDGRFMQVGGRARRRRGPRRAPAARACGARRPTPRPAHHLRSSTRSLNTMRTSLTPSPFGTRCARRRRGRRAVAAAGWEHACRRATPLSTPRSTASSTTWWPKRSSRTAGASAKQRGGGAAPTRPSAHPLSLLSLGLSGRARTTTATSSRTSWRR
jgi:hypothetical protein